MRVFTLLHAQHCLGICTMSAAQHMLHAQQTVTQALHCILIGLNQVGLLVLKTLQLAEV